MFQLPEVKLAIVAVSRDCFPIELAQRRRRAGVDAFRGQGLEIIEIQTTIEEYVTAKLKGETPAASPANPYIEGYVIDEIDDRIDTYIAHKLAGTVPTDAVDALVYEYADTTVNDFLDSSSFLYLNILNCRSFIYTESKFTS